MLIELRRCQVSVDLIESNETREAVGGAVGAAAGVPERRLRLDAGGAGAACGARVVGKTNVGATGESASNPCVDLIKTVEDGLCMVI
eukprot:6185556-Pleurochrysis_carterae.AAC.2